MTCPWYILKDTPFVAGAFFLPNFLKSSFVSIIGFGGMYEFKYIKVLAFC